MPRMKVILDLVMNHTSSQHPWFQNARKDAESEYRDYYIWAGPGTGLQARSLEPGGLACRRRFPLLRPVLE